MMEEEEEEEERRRRKEGVTENFTKLNFKCFTPGFRGKDHFFKISPSPFSIQLSRIQINQAGIDKSKNRALLGWIEGCS